MLGIILLVIGGVGLVLMLLSLIGVDFGGIDFDLGDSGAGFLSLLMPFVTGFGLVAGSMIEFGGSGRGVSLLVGAGAGLVMAITAAAVIRWLWHSGEELPSVDVLGSSARIVEAVLAGHYGTAEVSTPLGSRRVTVTADRDFPYDQKVRLVARLDEIDAYFVEQLPYADLDV
ncbi:MAG: hypothetical protein QM809_14140 [Gordonia sp. (in: high G+C Gram-positive bacteria)]|uniref:hypothetical protein n=1 Tax=Gordonia sp. (in: high G+C Gram-positive bacteria) TaxID=84139 RepID=UPI0039E6A69F